MAVTVVGTGTPVGVGAAVPPESEAQAEALSRTLRNLGIAQIVVGVLEIAMTLAYIDAILTIIMGATLVAAYNGNSSGAARARAINLTCTTGLAIAQLVLGCLTVIIFAIVFFTLGITFILIVNVLNNPGSIPDSRVTDYCTIGTNCVAMKATFSWLAMCFIMGWLLPLTQVILSSIVLCKYNAVVDLVRNRMPVAAGSTGVTVVMMPQAVMGAGAPAYPAQAMSPGYAPTAGAGPAAYPPGPGYTPGAPAYSSAGAAYPPGDGVYAPGGKVM